MLLAYVVEAGCTGQLPNESSPIQPVFTIVSVIVKQAEINQLTLDFLKWKSHFFPNLLQKQNHILDGIRAEVKGSDLRKRLRNSGKGQRFVIGVLDKFLRILEGHHISIIGRVWVKGIGQPFEGRSIYTSSMQSLCTCFDHLCSKQGDTGFMIADSRNKHKNETVSHSIFTQKFKAEGDAYPQLLEMPTFGHSGNHAGLQIADLVCSALLFPIAAQTYCASYVTNQMHISESYDVLKIHFGKRLRDLQFRYRDGDGKWKGGIVVSDPLAFRHGGLLFAPPASSCG